MDNNRSLFLIQQICATVFSLANKLQNKGDEYFEHLTIRQFMVMVAILHLPEHESTINNIARKLGTSKQSTKRVLTIIEDKGYVISEPCQIDKRAVNVKITKAGIELIKQCEKNSLKFFADTSKNFSIGEMEMLWTLLKKLYCFDGESQDGFEEEVNYKIFQSENGMQTIS